MKEFNEKGRLNKIRKQTAIRGLSIFIAAAIGLFGAALASKSGKMEKNNLQITEEMNDLDEKENSIVDQVMERLNKFGAKEISYEDLEGEFYQKAKVEDLIEDGNKKSELPLVGLRIKSFSEDEKIKSISTSKYSIYEIDKLEEARECALENLKENEELECVYVYPTKNEMNHKVIYRIRDHLDYLVKKPVKTKENKIEALKHVYQYCAYNGIELNTAMIMIDREKTITNLIKEVGEEARVSQLNESGTYDCFITAEGYNFHEKYGNLYAQSIIDADNKEKENLAAKELLESAKEDFSLDSNLNRTLLRGTFEPYKSSVINMVREVNNINKDNDFALTEQEVVTLVKSNIFLDFNNSLPLSSDKIQILSYHPLKR